MCLQKYVVLGKEKIRCCNLKRRFSKILIIAEQDSAVLLHIESLVFSR